MIYLFILESIGTSELMLIGLVALIVFGPRKLPELARMLGKAMNEFRRSTDDFKKTWEQEINFEKESFNDESLLTSGNLENSKSLETSVQQNHVPMKNEIVVPEIKEISSSDFAENASNNIASTETVEKVTKTDKRDWL